jgi:hypothetical protein
MGKDYSHRDLCSSTSGILQAFLRMSEKEYKDFDRETVEAIAEEFIRKHEEHEAETPIPEL